MVKFLHTADLHLGKVFHDYSLIEDQRYMLDALTGILSDPSYAALLISGDVYDRSIPSQEGVSLFSSFLVKLRAARPSLAVLILPGNHDSAARLGFGRELFSELGIHITSDPAAAFQPIMVKAGGDTCAFFLLPFLNPGSLMEERPLEEAAENLFLREGAAAEESGEPLRAQGKLAELAAKKLEAARRKAVEDGAAWTVLGAHLFAKGGKESESERIFLGTAEQVDSRLFAGFDYTALGHLHRFQKAGPNAWYSGSPLAYSFDESDQEKVFLSVELGGGETEVSAGERPLPRVNPIPVKPLRKPRRLQGPFNFFFRDSARDPAIVEAEKDYLEISLTDETLVENPLPLLRGRFPWLMSIKQGALARILRDEALPDGARREERRSPVDDFSDFLTGVYGEADSEKLSLFRELLEDLDKETSAVTEIVTDERNRELP
jgi:exonuclease SbcD